MQARLEQYEGGKAYRSRIWNRAPIIAFVVAIVVAIFVFMSSSSEPNAAKFFPKAEVVGGSRNIGPTGKKKQPTPQVQEVTKRKKDPDDWATPDDDYFDAVEGIKTTSPSIAAKKVEMYHIIMTTENSIYGQWMSQVCYYHYQKVRRINQSSAMGGFTRVVHTNGSDVLQDRIPSIVVSEIPEELTLHNYPPLNRPWAYVQIIREHWNKFPEPYILMAEPDHIFLSPPPMLATSQKAAAYPFFYMVPKDYPDILNRYVRNKAPIQAFPPIGNSPSIMTKEHLASIAEDWYDITLKFLEDKEATEAFHWILEMYSYSAASAGKDGGPLDYSLHSNFMVQPPYGEGVHTPFMLHFTYGLFETKDGACSASKDDYKEGGWKFDKREYWNQYPQRNYTMPPENCDSSVKTLISALNEASESIPDWGVL